ncbi:hypothetical protein JCM11491_000794 [Sporobolomyces phaffii]
MGYFRRAHWLVPLVLGTLIASLTYEPVQRSLIYLHWAKWPLPAFARFDLAEVYGFAPGKVKNVYLDTVDGAKIGAWLVLAQSAYSQALRAGKLSPRGQFEDVVFDAALTSTSHPTVLYFHGNAGTRAIGNRVRVAQHVSAMDCNFLIIDYRGFADSTSTPPPSEEGVLIDARTAFDYLHLEKGVDPAQISIMGQSLGTGIGTALAMRLQDEGLGIRSLILIAPFSSIATLLETYKLGNVIPLVSPLRGFPWLFNRLLELLRTKFDTKSIISDISCRILVVHARDDPVIPFTHSRTLTDYLRAAEPESRLVREETVGRWGTVQRFDRGRTRGRVVSAEATTGGHTFLGETEYVMRLIKETIFDEPQ